MRGSAGTILVALIQIGAVRGDRSAMDGQGVGSEIERYKVRWRGAK